MSQRSEDTAVGLDRCASRHTETTFCALYHQTDLDIIAAMLHCPAFPRRLISGKRTVYLRVRRDLFVSLPVTDETPATVCTFTFSFCCMSQIGCLSVDTHTRKRRILICAPPGYLRPTAAYGTVLIRQSRADTEAVSTHGELSHWLRVSTHAMSHSQEPSCSLRCNCRADPFWFLYCIMLTLSGEQYNIKSEP